MTKIAVFDINETTLDLTPAREVIDEQLGHVGGFTVWFQKLIQLAMTSTATDRYADFGTLGRFALQAIADTGSQAPPTDVWDRVASAMESVRGYPDVGPGLEQLRAQGWSTVALTNSAPSTVEGQLERAGLAPLFDQILSVDAVGKYKPAAAPYLYAAQQVGAAPDDLWMVACHDWDLAGARATGMATAFVSRPSMSYAPFYPPAEIEASDFVDLANQLARHGQ